MRTLLAIAFTVALLAPTLTLADITGQASGLLAEKWHFRGGRVFRASGLGTKR